MTVKIRPDIVATPVEGLMDQNEAVEWLGRLVKVARLDTIAPANMRATYILEESRVVNRLFKELTGVESTIEQYIEIVD